MLALYINSILLQDLQILDLEKNFLWVIFYGQDCTKSLPKMFKKGSMVYSLEQCKKKKSLKSVHFPYTFPVANNSNMHLNKHVKLKKKRL